MKDILREKYTLERKALSNTEVLNYSQLIFKNLLELNIWSKQCYHIFLPIENKREVATESIINYLFKENKQVVVPKINDIDNQLINCRLMPETFLTKNKWGILEPDFCRAVNSIKIEVIFIPLLISDKKGNRVGYGKGFYDKFLLNCSPDIIKIGINFFEPIEKIEPLHSNDLVLDYLVTPKNIFKY